jgi:hypothetical protein
MGKKMTPREEIALLYWKHPQPRTFDTDERLHRVTGYVLEGDGYFLMGRGVDSTFEEEMLIDPAVAFPRSRQDMWFIWAFCGRLDQIYYLQPYVLPMVGWIRHGQGLRIYETEAMRKKCSSKHITLMTQARTPV